MDPWMSPTMSQFSQMTLASVIFLISVSCASLNFVEASLLSYQNRSHFFSFWNWMPMMQAKVGPTRAPCRGVSLRPPVKRSMSSTLL